MWGEDYLLEFDIENIWLINVEEIDFQLEGLFIFGLVKDGLVNVLEVVQVFKVWVFFNLASDQISIFVEGV